MSSYRSRGGFQQPVYRSNFYDDRSRSRSRSRSPRRRSPPIDKPRDKSPPRYRDRSRERWPSRSRSTSPAQDDRPTSRGQPSREIMLEDIAPHVTENDILYELQQHYHVEHLDDVRIIKDRQTRKSRGFGFLRFATIEEAQAFMDANYPTIYIYGESAKGNTSSDAKVRLAYGRERKDGERTQDSDWICKVCNINNFATRLRCFRCQNLKPEPATTSKASNVGDNDAAPDNVPSQFLLLRGLEVTVSEELLSKGVAKLNKPASSSAQQISQPPKKGKVASTTGDANLGAKEGTLRRILLIRDKKTNESWRYGFAEYATIEDAQAALTRYNSFDRFTIASKQVLVSYIHAGVFVPVLNPTAATERFTFSPCGNPSVKLQYWDEDAYAAELLVNAPEPSEVVSKQPTTNPAESEGIKNVSDLDRSKKRKPLPEQTSAASKKATPSHLQFWSNRHAELHGINQKPDKAKAPNSDNGSIAPTHSYADPNRNCCYLCMRQFNSTAEVNNHERLSDLHRTNLKDEAKVKRAEHKLEKHGVTTQQASASPSDVSTSAAATEYRDRARERRKIYGVVNKKGEQVGAGTGNAKERSSPSPPSPPPSVQPSKGASLLSKMGYTSGSGLGASGSGMTAPITQDVYAAGVGLGAQGGKLGDAVEQAEKNTKGDYGDFVRENREKARERYRNM